jgi:hypothetical protein
MPTEFFDNISCANVMMGDVSWIHPVQDNVHCRPFVKTEINLRVSQNIDNFYISC